MSKQEATVLAIREAAARGGHEDRVRDLSTRAVESGYADLLDRLGRRSVGYLTAEDLLALVADLGVGPIQDPGLLDSASRGRSRRFSGALTACDQGRTLAGRDAAPACASAPTREATP